MSALKNATASLVALRAAFLHDDAATIGATMGSAAAALSALIDELELGLTMLGDATAAPGDVDALLRSLGEVSDDDTAPPSDTIPSDPEPGLIEDDPISAAMPTGEWDDAALRSQPRVDMAVWGCYTGVPL